MQRTVFMLGVIALAAIATIWTLHQAKAPSLESTNQSVLRFVEEQAISEAILSEQAEFPSPVIKLQQTLTQGLLHAESSHLPLLRGELAQFSQANISDSETQPEQIQQLRQKILQLKQMSTP